MGWKSSCQSHHVVLCQQSFLHCSLANFVGRLECFQTDQDRDLPSPERDQCKWSLCYEIQTQDKYTIIEFGEFFEFWVTHFFFHLRDRYRYCDVSPISTLDYCKKKIFVRLSNIIYYFWFNSNVVVSAQRHNSSE